MKIFTLKPVIALTAWVTLTLSANAFAMDVEFTDTAWDGEKIPEGQQCLNYDGKNPATPSMTVTNIPVGAESLVFVYNDVSNKRMQNGGHGIVEFALPKGATSAEVP